MQDAPPALVPLERYYRASELLRVIAPARRLAILDVLARRGPLPLGVVVYEAGCRTAGAEEDADGLRWAGLVTTERPTGRNLSQVLTITPSGRRVLELVEAMTAD